MDPIQSTELLTLVRGMSSNLQALATHTTGPAGPGQGTGPAEQVRLLQRFTYNLRQAGMAVANFSRSILPIPNTLGQLVRQASQAGAPSAFSTLQKSFDLVIAQIGYALVPALAFASRKLQEFAHWLSNKIGPGGAGFTVGERATIGTLGGAYLGGKLGGIPGAIAGAGLGYGAAGIHAGIDAARFTLDADKRAEGDAYIDGAYLDAKRRARIRAAGGVEAAGLFAGAGVWRGGAGAGTGGGGARRPGMLIDNPPGYQPRIGSYDQLREQLLMQAMKSPLDRAREAVEMASHRRLEKIAGDVGEMKGALVGGLPPRMPR